MSQYQSPPKNKNKVYYEHGKDALGLAIAIADVQEEKALRKAQRHQSRVGDSRKGREHASDGRKRLEEAKRMITKRRAEAKKDKAKARRDAQSRPQRRDDAKMTASEATSAAPRKRVSFAE